MRARVRGLEKNLKRAALALSGVSFTLLAPALAWATSTAGVGPWDTTLNLIQTDLSGPAAHALVTSAFVGSGVLYATGGGHGPGVSRLAAAGLGGAASLGGAGYGFAVPLLTNVVLSGGGSVSVDGFVNNGVHE